MQSSDDWEKLGNFLDTLNNYFINLLNNALKQEDINSIYFKNYNNLHTDKIIIDEQKFNLTLQNFKIF